MSKRGLELLGNPTGCGFHSGTDPETQLLGITGGNKIHSFETEKLPPRDKEKPPASFAVSTWGFQVMAVPLGPMLPLGGRGRQQWGKQSWEQRFSVSLVTYDSNIKIDTPRVHEDYLCDPSCGSSGEEVVSFEFNVAADLYN